MNDYIPKTVVGGAAVVRRNRVQMVIILAVALISLGGSYLLYYLAQDGDVWGTTNNGEWVEPPTTTADLGWPAVDGTRTWWLWTAAEDCDAACQTAAKNLRALHILLNREADRVQRGYTNLAGNNEAAWLSEFPDLREITLERPQGVSPGIYIVDPLGNLVFRYPVDSEPKPILEDLKRLLKVSQIG